MASTTAARSARGRGSTGKLSSEASAIVLSAVEYSQLLADVSAPVRALARKPATRPPRSSSAAATLRKREEYAAKDTARLEKRILGGPSAFDQEQLAVLVASTAASSVARGASRALRALEVRADMDAALRDQLAMHEAQRAEEDARQAKAHEEVMASVRDAKEAAAAAKVAAAATQREYVKGLRSQMAERAVAAEVALETVEQEAAMLATSAARAHEVAQATAAARVAKAREEAAEVARLNAIALERKRAAAAADAAEQARIDAYNAAVDAREAEEAKALELERLRAQRRRDHVIAAQARISGNKDEVENARQRAWQCERVMRERAEARAALERREATKASIAASMQAQIEARAAQRAAEAEAEARDAEQARALAAAHAEALREREDAKRASARDYKEALRRQMEEAAYLKRAAAARPLEERLSHAMAAEALTRVKEGLRADTLARLQSVHASHKILHAASTLPL